MGLLGLGASLVACQIGKMPDGPAATEKNLGVVMPAVVKGTDGVVTFDDGVWLGRRAVPIAPSAVSGPRRDTSEPQAGPNIWHVRTGDSVASTVRQWAEIAGYTPVPKFSANENWSFIVTQEFSGSFEEALAWLSSGFERQPVKPVVVLFANHTLDLIGSVSGDRSNGADPHKEMAEAGTFP